MVLHQEKKSFQTTQGGHKVIINLPIKNKMAATKKQCFFVFSENTVNKYSSRHSNPSFAHHLFYLLIAPKWREKESSPGVTLKRNHT